MKWIKYYEEYTSDSIGNACNEFNSIFYALGIFSQPSNHTDATSFNKITVSINFVDAFKDDNKRQNMPIFGPLINLLFTGKKVEIENDDGTIDVYDVSIADAYPQDSDQNILRSFDLTFKPDAKDISYLYDTNRHKGSSQQIAHYMLTLPELNNNYFKSMVDSLKLLLTDEWISNKLILTTKSSMGSRLESMELGLIRDVVKEMCNNPTQNLYSLVYKHITEKLSKQQVADFLISIKNSKAHSEFLKIINPGDIDDALKMNDIGF